MPSFTTELLAQVGERNLAMSKNAEEYLVEVCNAFVLYYKTYHMRDSIRRGAPTVRERAFFAVFKEQYEDMFETTRHYYTVAGRLVNFIAILFDSIDTSKGTKASITKFSNAVEKSPTHNYIVNLHKYNTTKYDLETSYLQKELYEIATRVGLTYAKATVKSVLAEAIQKKVKSIRNNLEIEY